LSLKKKGGNLARAFSFPLLRKTDFKKTKTGKEGLKKK